MGFVITHLYGGLGNQMFQYAAGLAVAQRLQSRLYVDTRWFDPRVHSGDSPPTIRRYGLDIFGISPGVPPSVRVRMKMRKSIWVTEEDSGFQPQLEDVRGDAVLIDGYWQSYRYLVGIEAEVRRAFRVPTTLSRIAQEYAREAGASDSVAVHVRRGDYLSNPKHLGRFGVLTPDYYRAAAAELQRRRRRLLSFLVFSDDPPWCRDNLVLEDAKRVTFVAGTADHEDLSLMASCHDHVIANSSFSWWGAWLGTAADKIVIAPARWAHDPQLDTPDRIPPDWLQL